MAKKIFAVMLGFALAPAFIAAEHTAGNTIVGTTCLVRVYHSQFKFPPEGGRIVQIGNEMYFWRTYLPECVNILPSNQPALVTSHSGTSSQGVNVNEGSQIVGEPCAIRVYHSDFRFPPEGGKIVKVGNETYFVRTYKPGCENALNGGTVLTASANHYNPLQTSVTTPGVTQANTNTVYTPVPSGTATKPSCY